MNIPTESGEGDCIAVQLVVKNDARLPLDLHVHRNYGMIDGTYYSRLPSTQNQISDFHKPIIAERMGLVKVIFANTFQGPFYCLECSSDDVETFHHLLRPIL